MTNVRTPKQHLGLCIQTFFDQVNKGEDKTWTVQQLTDWIVADGSLSITHCPPDFTLKAKETYNLPYKDFSLANFCPSRALLLRRRARLHVWGQLPPSRVLACADQVIFWNDHPSKATQFQVIKDRDADFSGHSFDGTKPDPLDLEAWCGPNEDMKRFEKGV